MGAWGEGIFENDAAGDWLNQLVSSGKPNAIDKAISLAIKARPGQLEADEACEALAAVEVIAAARGHRHADLPEEVKEWLAESGFFPTAAAATAGIQAAERVRDDSELKELWAEGDELPAWNRGIRGLLDRLAKPAKPPKPKPAAAKKPKAPPKPSPRTAIAALRKKGIHVIAKGGSAEPNWAMGSGSKTDKNPLCDADMEHFRQLESLEELSLGQFAITDVGLACLAGMTRLKKLTLRQMPISDASASVFERMTAVTSLNLSGTRVGDAVLEQVARMTKLRDLELDKSLPLSKTPGFGIAVTDTGIKHLRTCQKLEMISLKETRITDESLKWLAQIPSLKRIIVNGTGVTGRGLQLLKPLREHLTLLRLEDTAVDDDACRVLAEFKNLDGLSLEGPQVTGVGLRHLLALNKLDSLGLAKTALTDGDVPTLLQFPEKLRIYAPQTRITAKGKRLVTKAGRDEKIIV